MRTLAILLGLAGVATAVDVSLEWGLIPVGPNFADAVTADGAGNVYQCSHLYSTTTLDGAIPPVTTYGNDDWFISKQLPNGSFVWGTHFGGTFVDSCFGIAVNKAGTALYVAGIFKSTVFMAGPYTVQHTNGASSVSNDRADGAIVKVDAATGQPLWAIGMGSNVDTTRALGVVVDSEDNAVLTGNYRAPLTVPGLPVLMPFKTGSNNGFVLKITSDGDPIWLEGWGSDTTNQGVGALSIAVDLFDDNIYVGGFNYATSFTFAGKVVANNGNSGTGDMTIVVYSKEGNQLWAKSVGGTANDDPWFLNNIAVDGRRKAIYIATQSYSTSIVNAPITTANPYPMSQLIFKVDFDGKGIWTRNFGAGSGFNTACGIGVDKFGNVYFTGMMFNNGATYDGIALTGTSSDGWAPVVSLSAAGAVRWAGSMVGVWGYSGYAAPSNFYLVYGSGDLIRYNGTSGALVNPGPGSVNTLMSKFVWADPDPYGPLTLSGVISPGNRAAVVVRQGKLLTVTFTLTRPANKAAPKVLKRDWVWENYTLEVDVPGAVREIKQPKMTPASTSTTQRTVGSTLVWENVPMPANGHAGYKRKFRFKAVVDPRYTGMLAFDAMAYNDNALALKTLTANVVSHADYPQAVKNAKMQKPAKQPVKQKQANPTRSSLFHAQHGPKERPKGPMEGLANV